MFQPYINDITNFMNNNIQKPSKFTRVEALRVLNKYPERIPVIVNRSTTASQQTPHIDCHKFLVPDDLTVGQFMYVIRKRIALAPHEAMFLFIDNTVPLNSRLMSSVYDEMRDEKTLFLYVTYSLENTFG
jgi:GABA(A) receptor-associated protein